MDAAAPRVPQDATPQASLLGLPLELRWQIYSHLIVEVRHFSRFKEDSLAWTTHRRLHICLVLICSKIRTESWHYFRHVAVIDQSPDIQILRCLGVGDILDTSKRRFSTIELGVLQVHRPLHHDSNTSDTPATNNAIGVVLQTRTNPAWLEQVAVTWYDATDDDVYGDELAGVLAPLEMLKRSAASCNRTLLVVIRSIICKDGARSLSQDVVANALEAILGPEVLAVVPSAR